jgi:hypothetical protein
VIVQIAGSLTILAAYALAQVGVLDQKSQTYLLMNVLGAGALAYEALLEEQWGFLLLESVWAIVSTVSLVGVLRAGSPASPSD